MPLGDGLDHLIADWVVVVVNAAAVPPAQPTAFVLTPGEVAKRVHVSKDGKRSHWLQPKDGYDAVEFREAWGRMGKGY